MYIVLYVLCTLHYMCYVHCIICVMYIVLYVLCIPHIIINGWTHAMSNNVNNDRPQSQSQTLFDKQLLNLSFFS